MAFKIIIPFQAAQFFFNEEVALLQPLNTPQNLRLGHDFKNLAATYKKALQKHLKEEDNLLDWLSFLQAEGLSEGQMEVEFTQKDLHQRLPPFTLKLDYFYQKQKKHYWGLIPILGVEAVANKRDQLQERLEEAVRIEFTRKRRLQSIESLLPVLWWEKVKLREVNFQLEVRDPGQEFSTEEKESLELLQELATPLMVGTQQAYGRAAELSQFLQALTSPYQRSVLLVGQTGSGKSTLVKEAAFRLQEASIPGTIWETTASTMIRKLTTEEAGWEYNIGTLCRELANSDQLLFVSNLMDLFEVGKYIGNEISIADFLLPYLSRGEINLISECSPEELARIEINSPAYLSNFRIIRLEEPRTGLEDIIRKKVQDIAQAQSVRISNTDIQELIQLNRRFTPYSGMPGKPIRFLESLLLQAKEESVTERGHSILRSDILRYYSEESGLPLFMIDPSIPMDPEAVRRRFSSQLFGQETAIDHLVSVLSAVKTGLIRQHRPIASILFVGPTGVGKTELAKILASFMFGDRNRMLRFDMSEYATPYHVMRLTTRRNGSDGLLTAAVQRQPFSVILFDEVEKANDSFYDLLLQILSEGRLTDDQGRLTNFCSAIVIMTSNIGAERLSLNPIGFPKGSASEQTAQHFIRAVQNYFRPELIGRIDQIIPFYPLSPKVIQSVVKKEIDQLLNRQGLKFRKVNLEISPAIIQYLGSEGYQPQYGARFLQRLLREKVAVPLARILNESDPDDQLLLHLNVENEEPVVKGQTSELAFEVLVEQLDRVYLADLTSQFRREVQRFKESYYPTLLIQELDALEARRNSDSEEVQAAFWADYIAIDRYSKYQGLQLNIDALDDRIQGLEQHISLAVLDLDQYDPEKDRELNSWEQEFKRLLINLYTTMEEEANQCSIGVFGMQALNLANLYENLALEAGFECKKEAIWFRESYFNEQKALNFSNSDGYLRTRMEVHEKGTPSAEREEDQLCGYILKINGPAAQLYFQGEEGGQRYFYDKKPETLFITVENPPGMVPEGVHRKSFFRKLPVRRTFDPPKFRDTEWRLRRELEQDQYHPFLKDLLDGMVHQRVLQKLEL